MDTTTKGESARPLGVIGSLAAGFDVIGRHVWLIAPPVLLDLFLWLGPRLSMTPLLEQLVAFLLAQPAPDAATAQQMAQAAQLLGQLGERFNLFALLSALPLLNVPSLLAQHPPAAVPPWGQPRVQAVTSVVALMGWLVVLLPVGLTLGLLYLNSVARGVRAGRSSDGREPVTGVETAVLGPVRVIVFAMCLLAIGVVVVPMWMLLVGAAVAFVPLLGFLVWSLGIGLGSYVILHLLFVVPGLLIGGRGLVQAVWESILLIHTQFPSVLGLMLLVVVISQGLGFVWSLPSADSWLLAVGILGNGCIATGLTAAFFVFYRERIGQLTGQGGSQASGGAQA